jgi:site-specific DNA-methyltransferase (adenine-specific)
MSLRLFDTSRAWDPARAVTPEIDARRVLTTSLGVLYRGDCLELLPHVRREAIDTVFADPPFNLSKEYDVVFEPFGGGGTIYVHLN